MKNVYVTMRVTEGEKKYLVAIAKKEGRTVSSVARRLLRKAMGDPRWEQA